MGKAAKLAEEVWLRSYLELWPNDIFFSVEAQSAMREIPIYLPEVLALMRNSPVISSEKLEIGADIVVQGRNCDERLVQIEAWIECNLIEVQVLKIVAI